MTPGVLGVRTCDPAGAIGEDPVKDQGRGPGVPWNTE